MVTIDREAQVHSDLIEATSVVRAYAGSDVSVNTISMLDALAQSYVMDLVHCSVDDLVKIQSALKQVYAIRSVLSSDGQNIPKI